LLLAAATRRAQAQERASRHRIAMFRSAGSVTEISDAELRNWRAFFEELRRLGNVEGQTLTVDRYPARGIPSGLPISLARSLAATPT